MFGGPFPWEHTYGDLCDEALSKLTASLPFPRAGQVKTIVVVGKTAEQILRVAEDHHADLIVMGSPRRGLLSRLLLGSVTEHVLRKAPIPVIMMSSLDRASFRHPGRGEIDC